MISKDPIGTLTDPYLETSHPFGKRVEHLDRKVWFLETLTGLYKIEQFLDQPHRFILPQSYPLIEKKNLKSMVAYLLHLSKRLVLCT